MTMRLVSSVGAAAALLVASSTASALPCVSDALSSYLGLAAGCDVGDVTFSDFGLPEIPAGATPIDPAGITVTPLPSSGNPGLLFSFGTGFTADAGEFFDILIAFTATAGSGSSISGNSLNLVGDTSVVGDGVITVVEDKCLGGIFFTPPSGCSGDALTQIVFDVGLDSDTSESLVFAPVGFLAVVADLGIDGGLAVSASFPADGGFSVRFATRAGAAPEPSAAALIAVALFAIWLVPRRRPARAV